MATMSGSDDRPTVANELIRLDNTPENLDRPGIDELRRPRLMLSSPRRREAPGLELQQAHDPATWEAPLDDDLIVGWAGQDLEKIDSPAPEGAERALDAYLPKGDGITYHPKAATEEIHEPLVRRKGERVFPHGWVFPPEDRQVFVPSGYPWRCTGKVFTWTNPSSPGPSSAGAGALVGRNVVLTASHMVPWDSDPWMMQFIPGYWDGASLSGTSVYSYVQSVRGYEDHGQGDDMAVLRLYTALGDTLGYFGYKTYSDDWEDGNYWTKVGYPGMIAGGQRPSRVTWYPIVDDDSDGAGVELEYKADSSGGDSGGPVFGWWSGWPYVIGTHSGGEEEYVFPFSIVKNNVAAGGSALSSLIGWARSNW